jgi:hypothetical protein
MTENSHRPSAKIYQFPAGGRAGLVGARDAVRPAVETKPDRLAKAVAGGGCWYHEAAVEDAARPRARDRD